MSTTGDNLSDAGRGPGDREHASLDAVESVRPALGSLGAMQRDRAALRAALGAEMQVPLSRARASALRAAVGAAMEDARRHPCRDVTRDELDVGALAALGDGVALPPDPARAVVYRTRPGVLATIGPWIFSRGSVAAAAAVVVVGGVFYLASMTPAPRTPAKSVAQSPRDAGLPSWAVLPDRPVTPRASATRPPEATPEPVRVAEVTSTRDPALALRWLREGRLAVRLTTDAPRRDSARLEGMIAGANAGPWALAAAQGREAAVPAMAWPIDTRVADADGRGMIAARDNARVGAFELAVRPTAESLEMARESLELATRGGVVFERIDALAGEGVQLEAAGPSASGVLWWTKPAEQWLLRVRVPMVVEFGTPTR
ncbi:MAG TPA: hypothetical protein VF777_07390 [Phycisphaerales bacterium]